MAPSNTFLDDEDIRASIIAHDPQMVIRTGRAYGESEFEIHHDLNRAKEIEVLGGILRVSATGHTVDSLALQLWGRADEPLQRRVRGHFNPGSKLNSGMADGTVFLVDRDGMVEGRNRHSEALRMAQEATDLMQDRVTRKQEREFKRLGGAMKRAHKVAPDYKAELTEVATAGYEHVAKQVTQGQFALESGQ
jgi:hypothetical protein